VTRFQFPSEYLLFGSKLETQDNIDQVPEMHVVEITNQDHPHEQCSEHLEAQAHQSCHEEKEEILALVNQQDVFQEMVLQCHTDGSNLFKLQFAAPFTPLLAFSLSVLGIQAYESCQNRAGGGCEDETLHDIGGEWHLDEYSRSNATEAHDLDAIHFGD